MLDTDALSLLGDNAVVGSGPLGVKRTWAYHTNDALAEVAADGYFDSLAQSKVRHGDIILVAADLDGTPQGQLFVAVVTPGDVALTAFIDATA